MDLLASICHHYALPLTEAIKLPWGVAWELGEACERAEIRTNQLRLQASAIAFGAYKKGDSDAVLNGWSKKLAPKESQIVGETAVSMSDFSKRARAAKRLNSRKRRKDSTGGASQL